MKTYKTQVIYTPPPTEPVTLLDIVGLCVGFVFATAFLGLILIGPILAWSPYFN